MANFLQILVPLLSSIALLLAVAKTASSQVYYFNYEFSGAQPTELTYQGDAHFPSDTTYLRLTKTNASGYPERYSAGRVVETYPLKFWDSEMQVDFETGIKFLITAVDGNPGDGLVFFIAPVGTTIPTGYSGGNFGVFTTSVGVNPSIFVAEFDTFSNSYDPPYRHIGINIEHQASINTTRVDNAIVSQEVSALITYDHESAKIRFQVNATEQTFDVSYTFDLTTVLNQEVQVGLAATTGGSVAIHDVISWYFMAIPKPIPEIRTVV